MWGEPPSPLKERVANLAQQAATCVVGRDRGHADPVVETFLEKDQVKMLCCRPGEHLCIHGDTVLVLLPAVNYPLQAYFSGLYSVMGQVSDNYYVVSTPVRRRKAAFSRGALIHLTSHFLTFLFLFLSLNELASGFLFLGAGVTTHLRSTVR